MRAPRYPKVDDFWGRCDTCGFSIPARYLRLTRKHGWQCLPGNGRSRGCYDGNYDRDDIQYRYPAGEGARTVAAPVTNYRTEGLEGDPAYNTMYLYDQALGRGTVYLVTFGDPSITFAAAPGVATPNGGLAIASPADWTLFIRNGVLTHAKTKVPDTATNWLGTLLSVDSGGALDYTPFVPTVIA
jgi:hypothetical protein